MRRTHEHQGLPCSLTLRSFPLLETLSGARVGREGHSGRSNQGKEYKETWGTRAAATADPPAHQVQPHLGCLFCPIPQHGVRAGGLEGLQREEGAGEHRPAPSLMEGHLGKFGKGENSELSTFLFLFFFLRNFFPSALMTLPFLGGGGKEMLAWAPPAPNAGQSLTFHKKPELQSFLQMRWRLLPSPAPAPSPRLKPSVLAEEAQPGWEETPSTFFLSLSCCRN